MTHFTLIYRHLFEMKLLKLLIMMSIMIGATGFGVIQILIDSSKTHYFQSFEQINTEHASVVFDQSRPMSLSLYQQLQIAFEGYPELRLDIQVPQFQDGPIQWLAIDPLKETRIYQSNLSMFNRDANILLHPHNALISDDLVSSVSSDNTLTALYQGQAVSLHVLGTLQDKRLKQLIVTDLVSPSEKLINMPLGLSAMTVQANLAQIQAANISLDNDSVEIVPLRQLKAAGEELTDSFYRNLTILSCLGFLAAFFLILITLRFLITEKQPLFQRLHAMGLSVNECRFIGFSETFILMTVGLMLAIPLSYVLALALQDTFIATLENLYLTNNFPVLMLPMTLCKMIGFTVLSTLAATSPLLNKVLVQNANHTPKPFGHIKFAALNVILICLLLSCLIMPMPEVWGNIILLAVLLALVIVNISPLNNALITFICRCVKISQLKTKLAMSQFIQQISDTNILLIGLSITLAIVIGLSTMVSNFRDNVISWLETRLGADIYLNIQHGYRGSPEVDELINRLNQLQDRLSVSHFAENRILFHERYTNLLEINPLAEQQEEYHPIKSVKQGWTKLIANQGVWISESFANRFKLTVGDKITLFHTVSLPILAVFEDFATEHGRILINSNGLNESNIAKPVESIGIYLHRMSVDELKAALSDFEHMVNYYEQSNIKALSLAVFDKTFKMTRVLQSIIIVIGFLSVILILLIMQLKQAKTMATLYSLGVSTLEQAQIVLCQVALIASISAAWGILIGQGLSMYLVKVVLYQSFGWTVQYHFAPDIILNTLTVHGLVCLLASIYPLWHTHKMTQFEHLN